MIDSNRVRTPLLALAGARTLLSIAAIPLAPALYRDHFVLLVLLRPTKEVLLAAGFFVKRGDVGLVPVLLAAVPLAILGVWHFFALGRAYADEIRTGRGLPRVAERILPTSQIQKLSKVLDRTGPKVIGLGRMAAFPSALLGAAAGSSGMEPKPFLLTDTIAGVASIAEVMLAGYVLGEAYKRAGPWLTGAGVVALLALLVLVGRWLRREPRPG